MEPKSKISEYAGVIAIGSFVVSMLFLAVIWYVFV
jgi:hypothetical protein